VVREGRVSVGDEVARRGLALGVVFHVEGDGPAGLGAASHVVELKPHQGLHQGALAVRLVAHHQNRRRVERRLQVLGQRVKLIVGFVEAPLPLLLLLFLRQLHLPLPLHFQITLPSSSSASHFPTTLPSTASSSNSHLPSYPLFKFPTGRKRSHDVIRCVTN